MKLSIPELTPARLKDSGLVLVLILVLAARLWGISWAITAIIPLVLLTILIPKALWPFAWTWFALGEVLGAFVSPVLLSLVFFLVVTPMGLIRRMLGKDSLKLKQFKQGKGSVFTVRDKTVGPEDLEQVF